MKKPKKNLSGYMLFCGARRGPIKQEQPSLQMVDIAKAMSVEWNNLTVEGKAKYNNLALEDKAVTPHLFTPHPNIYTMYKLPSLCSDTKKSSRHRPINWASRRQS